jgi:type I restriction enzyme S subunit
MEVKSGYKQTELGVIPEDWECTTVGELARKGILEKPLDGNHGNIHPKSGDFVSFGIPFVMANNIRGGHVDLSNCAFIRKEQADSLQKGFSRPGDVLLTHKATIGNTALVKDIPFEYIMLTPQVTYYRVADPAQLSNIYLRQFFDSSAFQSVLLTMSGGGTRSYIGITAQLQLPVILPPTKAEQEAIAEALSDVDALIESLKQLLAKKRQLKQGAMQELLTGKKRLPGFSDAWAMKRLGEMGEIAGAGVDKKIRNGERPVRLINYMDVYRQDFIYGTDLDHWVTAPQHQVRRCAVQKGDVFFTPSSETRDDIANSAVAMEDISDASYSYHLVRLRLREPWDLRFRAYAFKTREFFDQAETLCDGSGTRYVISLSKFRGISIKVPPPDEQTAIAAILSDMDDEIAVLEAKLAKARQLKQGMMQELLTGRLRLV